jgi:hypothetical protein
MRIRTSWSARTPGPGVADSCAMAGDRGSALTLRDLEPHNPESEPVGPTLGPTGLFGRPMDQVAACLYAMEKRHDLGLFKIRSITSAPVVITGRSSCR